MREDKIKSRFKLYLFANTEKAVLVGKLPESKVLNEAFWLPKSQIDLIDEKHNGWDNVATIDIPQWLAERHEIDATLDGEVVE